MRRDVWLAEAVGVCTGNGTGGFASLTGWAKEAIAADLEDIT
eukprot:SAG22_NODE_16751_length_318_cov_1.210046_1_plen_41_part_10